jgi:hypothetical protein
LDASPVTNQNVQAIGVHVGADHTEMAIADCTPLQEQSTTVEFVRGDKITVPTLEGVIESVPLEADISGPVKVLEGNILQYIARNHKN